MAGGTGPLTVGIDIGTTSVKAVCADEGGRVVARARVPHSLFHPSPGSIEHDARKAWRNGPRRAAAAVLADGAAPSAVCIASMVPSMAAVGSRGIPVSPGILYDDARGRPNPPAAGSQAGGLPGDGMAEGMLRWIAREVPHARGYWPAQAVASRALDGPPAIDTVAAASLGSLHTWGKWNSDLLSDVGVGEEQMPEVTPMGQPAGVLRLPGGTSTVLAGGTVDAFCDQIVSGAVHSGDVLVICGATLVVWAVIDEWREVPGMWTVPHTVAGKVLIGGASNAGGLFVDWARGLLGLGGWRRSKGVEDPWRVPIWLPYLRGERVPYHDPERRSALHNLDVAHDAGALERAAYEASGFVVRHFLERAGVAAGRIVASGGGTCSAPWMQGLADASGLPVDAVAVPQGAALGAAFLARMALGLEENVDGALRWAATGTRTEPQPRWSEATADRYRQFVALSEAA